jgi:hypothetical protein
MTLVDSREKRSGKFYTVPTGKTTIPHVSSNVKGKDGTFQTDCTK